MTGPAPGGLYNARRSRTRGPASRDKAPGERRDTPFWRPRRLRCRSPPRPSAPALARGTRVPFPTAATNTSAALRRSAPPHSSGSRIRGVAPYRSPPKSNRAEKWGFSNSRGQLCSWGGAHVPRGGIARAARSFASAPPNWSVPTRVGFRCRRGSSGTTQGSTAVGPASPDNPSAPGGW
jgi:hypothetical protein